METEELERIKEYIRAVLKMDFRDGGRVRRKVREEFAWKWKLYKENVDMDEVEEGFAAGVRRMVMCSGLVRNIEERDRMSQLEVNDLKKYFTSGIIKKHYIKAVDGVSFSINKGETLGLVGESGCGKTTIGRSILRLIEPLSGEVIFNGIDILKLRKKNLRKLRPSMQMIFQDPDSSLNPRMKIGTSIAEPFKLHSTISKDERAQKIYLGEEA